MKAINDLIQQNDRDIARFREQIAKLLGKPGTQRHLDDFERCIAIAEKQLKDLTDRLTAMRGAPVEEDERERPR